MPKIGWPEMLIVLVILLLLFGGGRLRTLGRELGEGIGGFRKVMENEAGEEKATGEETA